MNSAIHPPGRPQLSTGHRAQRRLPWAVLQGLCLTLSAAVGAAPEPRNFTNLQVLSADVSTAQLLETMRDMSLALGAQCNTCHRTDIRDYASDEIEAKRRAREMMRMTVQMNSWARQNRAAEQAELSCIGCHRGQLKP